MNVKVTARNEERKESKLDVKTSYRNRQEEKSKPRKTKKNIGTELSKQFQRAVTRDNKQYYNSICRDIENGRIHFVEEKSSKRSLNSGGSNLELVTEGHQWRDSNQFKVYQKKMEGVYTAQKRGQHPRFLRSNSPLQQLLVLEGEVRTTLQSLPS